MRLFSLMDIYRGITTCIPGSSETILLWKDTWDSGVILQDSMPHLFSFSTNEDVSLAQFLGTGKFEF